MGMGQIMGFNYADAGYASAKAMFQEFSLGEQYQVISMTKLIHSRSSWNQAVLDMDPYAFALHYNGDSSGDYAKKIKSAYKEITGKEL